MAVAMESDRVESREGRRLEKFAIEGTHFVDLKDGNILIIVRGMVNGMQLALRRICPKELLPVKGEDGGYRIGGFMQGLRDMARSTAGRVLQVAGVGCAAMAGACGAPVDTDTASDHNSPGMSGQFGVAKSALMGSDISHFETPHPVPWSEWGDDSIEITEYEGKKVIIFSRWVGEEDDEYGGIFYVECNELEKCITEEIPQEIQGLQESFPAFWSSKMPDDPLPPDYLANFGSGTIFKNADGKYQLFTGAEGLSILADVKKNSDGVLEASNFQSPPCGQCGGAGPVPIDGVPHLVHGDPVKLLNLHTWEDKEIGNIPTIEECGGTPQWSEEGSWVVDVKGKYEQGKPVCGFVSAASLEDLINKVGVKYLKNINDYNKTAEDAWDPRIGQNVFIYVVQGPFGHKLYYALIEPYCGDGNIDPGETFENCPQDVPQPPTDTVINPPDADAGSTTSPDVAVGTDTIQVDGVSIDTASLDAALAETMKEVDGAVGPDSGADGKGADTQPDTQSNTDTLVSLCDDVEFEGDCDMSCNEPNATFTGKCTATVNIGGKFVEFEIDGEYTFNLLEEAGNLLKGGVEVDDKGVGVPTSYGPYDFVPTGTVYRPEGIVEGNFEMCKVLLKEGQITVYYNGEEIAVLSAGDEVTYDKGKPIMPVQPEVGEDTSQTDASEGTDADKPDLGGGKDAGGSVDTPNNPGEDTVAQVEPKKGGGGGGGGCSVSPAGTSKTTESGSAIPLGAVGLALLALVRKLRTPKEKAVEVESPRS